MRELVRAGRWGAAASAGRASAGRAAPGGTSPGERGDVITSWLLRLVVTMAVLGLLTYEALAIVVTGVALDDSAREVARAARDEYRGARSLDRATTIAGAVAGTHGAQVTSVTEDGDALVIDLQKSAPTLVVHHLGPFEGLRTASASARIRWAP
jgi:hypothetical protein